MAAPIVIFVGDFSGERIALGDAASRFGWGVQRVADLDSLQRVSSEADITAVFVDQRTPGTSDAIRLRRIRALLPNARITLCCPIQWIFDFDPDELGVFHAIARPLKIEELTTSIGFVWEAWLRENARSRAVAAA
jgi:DNA-binding NtrC family response regulator